MRPLHVKSARAVFLALLVLALTAGQCSGPANSRPVANAGADQTMGVWSTARMDGSASSDPDGDALAFAWAFADAPPGSAASLSGADTSTPTFTPDLSGTYVLALTVSDGALESTDVATVTSSNDAPEISMATSRQANPGETIDVPVTLADENPSGVTLTASSNDSFVDIEILGSGVERTLRITAPDDPTDFVIIVVSVVATDSEGLEGTATLVLDVICPNGC